MSIARKTKPKPPSRAASPLKAPAPAAKKMPVKSMKKAPAHGKGAVRA